MRTAASTPPVQPIEVTLFHDVLSAWCYLADARLESLRRELGPLIRFRVRPFALRISDSLPTEVEKREWLEELALARREPDTEARLLSDELWTTQDPPRSSLPALTALEAARIQGVAAHQALYRSMQRIALEQGVNVTRADVVFELASRVGLDMNRFEAAWRSPQTLGLVLEDLRLASVRGVQSAPTLVIGGRWMVSGLRDVTEYRELILSCLGKLPRPRSYSEQSLH